eukprot:scaffold157892_cov27-Tisochrysis_lutea.AAC.4
MLQRLRAAALAASIASFRRIASLAARAAKRCARKAAIGRPGSERSRKALRTGIVAHRTPSSTFCVTGIAGAIRCTHSTSCRLWINLQICVACVGRASVRRVHVHGWYTLL